MGLATHRHRRSRRRRQRMHLSESPVHPSTRVALEPDRGQPGRSCVLTVLSDVPQPAEIKVCNPSVGLTSRLVFCYTIRQAKTL